MADSIFILKNPNDFFNGLIDEALRIQNIKIQDSLRFYLLTLLSNNLENNTTQYDNTPFAILLHQAALAPTEEKRNILKFVGDSSLYTAGFFCQSLNKKLVNRDYYIGVGRIAFSSLSSVASSKTMQELYWDLFKNFNDMVTVLIEVSAKTFSYRPEDIVKLYEAWQNTKSKIIEKILHEKGVVTEVDKKKN